MDDQAIVLAATAIDRMVAVALGEGVDAPERAPADVVHPSRHAQLRHARYIARMIP